LESAPVFDKKAEDGTRFCIYRLDGLEVRTIDEMVGAVFSISTPAAEEHEKWWSGVEYLFPLDADAAHDDSIQNDDGEETERERAQKREDEIKAKWEPRSPTSAALRAEKASVHNEAVAEKMQKLQEKSEMREVEIVTKAELKKVLDSKKIHTALACMASFMLPNSLALMGLPAAQKRPSRTGIM